ncbi:MAG TPA: lysylphosphatidylglycerol synthase domain-containing protein, partial [Isosphaeraceae bacterium]|nr:lysylphosphatidylglycerol synthase domain-containing protein [Isosphaeraceae bacterium]
FFTPASVFGSPSAGDEAATQVPRSASRRKWVILTVKLALAAVVVWAVGRHVARTWRDLHTHGQGITIDVGWMAVSVALYLAGLSAFGLYFWKVMQDSPTPVALAPAVRAYLVSHLGKYVPGKAMVVVIRAALVVPYGSRPATAAFATLYETLVMMAAGSLMAGLGFLLRPIAPIPISFGSGVVVPLPVAELSLALALAFFVPTLPRVFPRLSAWISLPFPGVGPESLPRFSWSLLAVGILCAWVGWALLGLSQVAVVRALRPSGVPIQAWPLVFASVALATSAGFAVAVLPAGLGVRELVIMTTLAPAVGPDLAVVSALALRLAWVIGEVLAAVVLAVVRPPLPLPLPRPAP